MAQKQQYKTVSLFTAGVITTMSITLVLFLLGLTILIGFTAKGMGDYLKESLGISIELADNIDENSIEKIKKALDSSPYIKSTTYISKEETKKKLIAELGRDPEEVQGYNPANAYIDVYLKAEYMETDSLPKVKESITKISSKGGSIVSNLIYSDGDITNVNKNLSLIGTILIILAIILMFISFTLIRSIIQLNIYSKRFLINTMQLVGATNSFIRKPFLWRMILSGIIAAILANIAITGVVYYVTNIIPEIISIVKIQELLIVYTLVLILGIIITSIATASAVNRYLRMTTNKLYHV